MNIILGATGQVGSTIIKEIKGKGFSARAVVRNSRKLSDQSVEVRKADYFNVQQLIEALKGGTTVLLLTPENLTSNDILGETQQIVENYKKAVEATGIKKVVGLSSIGAHVEGNTGNLIMSRILENAFDDLDVEKVFIRPSYYYSNWFGYLETVEQHGVLPTFFPEELKIHMNSPIDVAKFIAKMFTESEANALVTAEQLISESKDETMIKEFSEVVSKVKAILKHSVKEKVSLLEKRILIRRSENQEMSSSHLSVVQLAITNSQLAQIDYVDEFKNITNRVIESFALYGGNEKWVLFAYCRLRKDFRAFRLDRIQRLKLLEEKFQPHSLTLSQFLEKYYGTPDT